MSRAVISDYLVFLLVISSPQIIADQKLPSGKAGRTDHERMTLAEPPHRSKATRHLPQK
jgi:hypothetical protein